MEAIGPLQIQVMRILWARGGCTVAQVHEEINRRRADKPLAYTTVLTVMRNLARRGIVNQRAVGRAHSFDPIIDATSYRQIVLDRLREDLFDGDTEAMVNEINRIARESASRTVDAAQHSSHSNS